MIHKVEITETLSRVVEVDAESREEAELQVQEWYNNGYVVLDAEDLKESSIEIYEEEQPEHRPEHRETKYREMER